jgi:ribosomal-protein-alanine N-acetyltransferase
MRRSRVSAADAPDRSGARILIEPLRSLDEIDEVMAVEAVSFTNPWTREMYLSDLEHQGVSHVVVARTDRREAVGFCSYWHVVDELRVNNLAVVPAWRRHGVGSRLLLHVLAQARAGGIARASLEVRRSNEPARRLYERLGFAVTGVRSGYYSHPVEDALVLWHDHVAEAAGDDKA